MELQNPALEVPKNPFVYGHTGTVEAIAGGHAPDGWRAAWNPLSFDALHWSTTYGDAMWNHASVRFMTLDEALAQWPEEGWHMRPCGADSGPKAFKGFFSTRAELNEAWATSRQGRGRNEHTRVAVSSARLPHEEYRLVFMQGVCVDASLYLVDGRLTLSRGAPAHVIDYATASPVIIRCPVRIARWMWAWTPRDMGIIEFNSLHSSGLYAMDRTAIVRGIARTW